MVDGLPKVGDVRYTTIYGHYLGSNSLHGELDLKTLLCTLYDHRAHNSLPGIDPRVFQPCEIILYINFESIITILHPEDHRIEH